MRDLEIYRTRLQARKAELDERLHKIEDRLDDTPDPDVEERAVEREDDEMLEGLGNAGKQELQKIENALGRMENGTYGVCISCGEDISEARLDIVAYATKCKHCM
ncbi:TraR/DksA family transcriptional regulator [uncultured Maritalea sp.]|jgi:RNA polymerase-binding transcription factor DksA|uniref:TraR/DksA family transcriptional regulator n=1 Tax=uncultured Maritalea sp. TaxID=757249 RepID=UPI00261B61D6|nr:TraR/DksA family transcriptional regulator [uncultured Maritalea sp.]